jgi:AraC family transcriptional regulator
VNPPADSLPLTFGSPRALVTEVDGFVVSDLRFEADLDLPRHTHDRATVAVLLAGSMVQRDGSGHSTDCREGSVLVEPAGDLHANRFDGAGACVLVVQPDPGGREMLTPFLPVLERRAHLQDIDVAALARRLTHEMRAPDDLTPLSVTGLVLELLARAARLAGPRVGGRPPPWLAATRELLQDRFSEPLRVGEVAAAAGVHPVHLARVFRAHYGMPVSAYLRGLRVDWAANRLATTDEPIAQIADLAGFNDQSHLTRSMRARLGATPLEWRQSARGAR